MKEKVTADCKRNDTHILTSDNDNTNENITLDSGFPMLCRLGNGCICFSFHGATDQWSSNFTVRNFSPGEKVSFQDQGLPDSEFRVCNTVRDRGLHGSDE